MAERSTIPGLDAWRVDDLDDGFADRVLARLDERVLDDDAIVRLAAPAPDEPVRLVPAPARPRSRRAGVLAIAGAAVAAAALLLLWLVPEAPAPTPPPRAAAPVSVAAPRLPAAQGLDPAAIRRALEEQLAPRARLCHEAMMVNGTLEGGQVIVRLDVVRRDGRGVVSRAEIDPISELEDGFFRDCLLRAARAVVFEPPRGDEPVEIECPLEFQSW